MEKNQVEYFKTLLQQQLEELIRTGNETITSIQEQDELYADPVDQAFMDHNLSMKIRIKDREHRLIKKIKDALDRLEEGTYGICEICEEDIAIERLKARPVTTQCIHCKVRGEQMEQVFEHRIYERPLPN